MIKWCRHNWGWLLGLYALIVVYGLFVRDFGLWGAFFTAPVGFAIVAALLFLIVYETVTICFPFLANTALFFARLVLPEARFVRLVGWANAHWERVPEFIKESRWMPYIR